MCETELIKLCLFLSVVGFVTLSVIAIMKIEKYIDNKYYGGNRYKDCLYWS